MEAVDSVFAGGSARVIQEVQIAVLASSINDMRKEGAFISQMIEKANPIPLEKGRGTLIDTRA